jgi:hypothetical protein
MTVSGPSRFRTIAIVLLGFVAAAAAAAGVAVYQRTVLVHWLVTEALTAEGLGSTRFAVEQVGLDRLVLSGVHANLGGDLGIGRITVRYAPLEILDRHIRSLEIEGFRFVLAPREDGEGLSIAFPESLPGPSGGGGPAWTIGTVNVSDTRISVEGGWTAEAIVDGTARHLEGESYRGTLKVQGSVTPPRLATTKLGGTIAFTASPKGIQRLTGEFAADPLHLPEIASRTGRLETTLEDGVLTLRGEVLTDGGRVGLDAEGPLPSAPLAAAPRGRATLDIDLAGIEIAGAPAPVAVKGRVLVVSDDRALTVRALEPLVATLTGGSRPVGVRILPNPEPLVTTASLKPFPEPIPAEAEVRIADARIEAAGRAFALGDVDATVTVDPTRRIDLRRARIRDLGPPPALAPLTLAGRLSLDDPDLRFTGTASAADGKVVVDLDGNHRVDTDTGSARVRLHRLRFRPGVLQPSDLIFGLGDALSAVTGAIEAGGSLRWGRGAPASDITVHAEDLSFDLEGLRVDGVDGKVVIDRPWPLRTPPGQTLVARRIDIGAPMTDPVIRFRIDDASRLAIDEARVGLLGGRFAVGPLIVDPAADRHRAKVRLTGIDMESLIAIADIDGATASGRLSGKIPLVISSDGYSVTDAVLKTDAPGVLHYAPASPPAALQGGGEGVSLMLEALKNFHYDEVGVTVDGRSGDEWSIKFHIGGKNPDFMDGYPFVFNLNLSGRLDEIIRDGLRSYAHPARLGQGTSKGRSSTDK